MIVGEAWGRREAEKGKPFVGPSGDLLNAFLSSAGLDRSDCYLTNVFNFQPDGNNLMNLCGTKAEGLPGRKPIKSGKYIRAEFQHELTRLEQEIETVNPNLIVACGSTATWALLNDPRIKRLRGYVTQGTSGHKVLPTYHPAAVLRQMELRPVVFADFQKIAKEAQFPEIVRPVREFWLYPTLEDLDLFEAEILKSHYLSVDIETWNRQITCIGFAPRPDLALVIPFVAHGFPQCNYWPDTETELKVWDRVAKWLSLGKRIVGQNFLYDANYLWRIYGIPVFDIEVDTMLVNHALQPEMEKSLAVLGSLYTDEPSWKFMRADHKTLKKED